MMDGTSSAAANACPWVVRDDAIVIPSRIGRVGRFRMVVAALIPLVAAAYTVAGALRPDTAFFYSRQITLMGGIPMFLAGVVHACLVWMSEGRPIAVFSPDKIRLPWVTVPAANVGRVWVDTRPEYGEGVCSLMAQTDTAEPELLALVPPGVLSVPDCRQLLSLVGKWYPGK